MTCKLPSRVVLVSDFSNVRGGASKLAMMQAKLLAEQGIPVTVFCGDEGAPVSAGVEIEALGGQSLLEQGALSAAMSGLWNRNAQLRLAEWVARHDCADTIYHVHGYHQTLSPSVLWPLARVSRRTVMHAHDYFLGCPNGAFFDFRQRATCERKAMSASCVLRNCDKRSYGQKLWRVMRQAVQNRGRSRLLPGMTTVLIHQDMEGRLFPDGAHGPVAVIANPSDPLTDKPVASRRNDEFLYVGDIHAYKGVFLLAEAGRQAGVKLRFVGDGQDLDKIRKTFPEHQFDGWQNREGLQRALADARMLVAPTLGPEPFGLAPVEALLCGVPVLASDSLLLSHEICAQDMGARFQAGNRNALATALVELSEDDSKITQMSNNASSSGHLVALTPQDWCASLLTLYEEILRGLQEMPRAKDGYAQAAY